MDHAFSGHTVDGISRCKVSSSTRGLQNFKLLFILCLCVRCFQVLGCLVFKEFMSDERNDWHHCAAVIGLSQMPPDCSAVVIGASFTDLNGRNSRDRYIATLIGSYEEYMSLDHLKPLASKADTTQNDAGS
jgi:hypothetical protein